MIRAGAICSVFLRSCLATILLSASAAVVVGQQPIETRPSATTPKPKKIYTNDDIQPAASEATTRPANASTQPGKDRNAGLARTMRAKLQKLAAQINDADKQIGDLKRFQAGELSGDAGRQLHKAYRTTPIPEQIAKLEEKKRQLQAQVEAIYDEARKEGILPGELR